MKKFTKEHEWIELEDDGIATVGISDHAQQTLGDITFAELPEVGAVFAQGDVFGVVESVKAASDIYLPVGGKIVAVNEQLEGFPQLLNSDAEGLGWIVKIELSNPIELEGLMSKEQYLGSI
jgi:glycine cleavage system H protein